MVRGLWLRGALGESAESTPWVLPGGEVNILRLMSNRSTMSTGWTQHFEVEVCNNLILITCISLPFPYVLHTSLHLSIFPPPFLKPWTRRGMNMVLVARDKKSLESLAVEVQALGVEAKVVVEDFTKEGAVDRVVNKVWKNRLSCKTDHILGGQPRAWGSREQRRGDGRPLYALPGHAAGGRRGHDQGQHHHSCGGELPGTRDQPSFSFQLCHRLIPPMVARGQGAVVNIASIMAYQVGIPITYGQAGQDLINYKLDREVKN